jgi:hypothetical protein
MCVKCRIWLKKYKKNISNILMIRTVNTIHTQSLSASAIAAIKDLADSVFLYVFPKIIPNGFIQLEHEKCALVTKANLKFCEE